MARAGTPFQGDTLDSLEVALPFYPNNMRYSHNAQNSFNNLGEVIFKYSLQNGQAGIALASVEFQPNLPDELFRDGFETLLQNQVLGLHEQAEPGLSPCKIAYNPGMPVAQCLDRRKPQD